MCGRTACTLEPDELCKACSVRMPSNKGGKGQYQAPKWRDHPGSKSYTTSFNIAPSRFTPVIISDRHNRGVKRQRDQEEQPPQYVIQPMMWGLIPPFYKGSSPTGHGLSTNNCRVENIEEKGSYMPSLHKGQRCVVLCDGFYEWKVIKKKVKQPYFVYAQQPDGIEIWNRESWDKPEVWSEDDGWKGPQLLKMAGLFSSWLSTEGEEVMSYTVLTMESGKRFSSVHHRVPAILETDQDVLDWLDSGRIGYKKALMNLKNDVELTWHPVSTTVNNSRNQEPNLNIPHSLEKKSPESASRTLMDKWLNRGSLKKEEASLKEEKEPIKTEKSSESASRTQMDKWLNRGSLKKEEASLKEEKEEPIKTESV